ncbi:MAG: hypothetical protein K6C97_12610 [Treponema sp.]|nr:hypothetical protein [Treponema sp.]
MKRIISISMAIVIFALSVLPSVPVYAISDDPTIAAHQGDCPALYVPLTDACYTDPNGCLSFAVDTLLNVFTFGWLGSKTTDDYFRDVTEAYVSSVVATDETNFDSIVTDMLASGCANYIYIEQYSGKTLAGAYFWELLDGICDDYFTYQEGDDAVSGAVIGNWRKFDVTYESYYFNRYNSTTTENIYVCHLVSNNFVVATLENYGAGNNYTKSKFSFATDSLSGNGFYPNISQSGYKYYIVPGSNFGDMFTDYSDTLTALNDLHGASVPDVGDPNGDGYTREPDTSLTFDPSTWFSFDWPEISNDTYITEGSDYSTTTVNYNEYINNYYNYASDDSTNLLLRILVTLREYLPILADISDMVSDGFTQTNEYLSEIASNISFLEDIKSLLEDIKATTLAIFAAVVFDHDVTEIVNDEDDGNAVTYTIGFIILVLLIFVYILKIAVHLLAFIVAFFNIEAAIDPDFLPEGMITGFQWLDEIIIPYFEVSVWDMMQTFLFVVVIFAIVHQILKFAKDFKFVE